MQITNVVANLIGPLLAGDDSSLGPASSPCKVALVENDFNPTINTMIGDLTVCAVAGLTPIAVATGDQYESRDPLTGEIVVEMKPPAGGFYFEATSGTGLPKTIYGIAVINNGGSTLFMSERFETPVVINAVNQVVPCPRVCLRIDPTKIS